MAGPKTDMPDWISYRQLAMGGLNTLKDPQDLDPKESPGMRNVTYDDGIIGPRNGSLLYLAKPSGETAAPFQLMRAQDSRGNDYLVSVFGGNFYLCDQGAAGTTGEQQWIKINGKFTPSQTQKVYGYDTWHAGIGSDYFYFCNGYDALLKWFVTLNYLSVAAASSDTQLTLADSSMFPSSGTLVVKGNSGTFNLSIIGYGYTGTLQMPQNPSSGDTWTLVIQGTSISGQFVSSIGSTAGNVLVGSISNFLGLLQAPGTTNATQVALSSPNQALVSLFTYTLAGTTITAVGSSGVTQPPTGAFSTNSDTVSFIRDGRMFISGTVGQIVPVGAAVTMGIQTMDSSPVGKVIRIASPQSYARLFVANSPQGGENKLNYSQSGNPDSFVTTTDLTSGGSRQITAGEGGILDIIDFGQYLAIIKHNRLLSYYFLLNSTLGAFVDTYTDLAYGVSLSPVGGYVEIVAENELYIPTLDEGIFRITPSSTGLTSSTTVTPISNDIFPSLASKITFNSGRVELYQRKIHWACSTLDTPEIVDPSTLTNDIVLVYDLLWQQWLVYDNWDAVDIRSANSELYYLSRNDGGLYLTGQDFEDASSGSTIGYDSFVYTPRFDFGKPSEVKTFKGPVYIEGYIDPATTLSISVLYNENGSLTQQNFTIDGSNSKYVQIIPPAYDGAQILGYAGLGGQNPAQASVTAPAQGIFRVYLDVSRSFSFYNVQLLFSTSDPGSNWNIGGIGFNLNPELRIPTELIISPSA